MAIKVDLEKAYDRVDWRFLEDTLIDLKFPAHMAKLIMTYVSSSSMRFI